MALIGSAAIWPGHILTRINVRTVFEIAVRVDMQTQQFYMITKGTARNENYAFKHYIESFERIELIA